MKNSLNALSEQEVSELVKSAESICKTGGCCPVLCGGVTKPCGRVDTGIKVASFSVHNGEEPPVSGWNGAGNVFFSGCSARCIFCQNWPISHKNNGRVYSESEFAESILKLIDRKVHNINLVTSDHYFDKVVKVFQKIRKKITVPIYYNCNGSHTQDLFKLILKISDVLLFDVKYADNDLSENYSCIENYHSYNMINLEMLLEKNISWIENSLGILQKGLIIRHLVLPGHVENSIEVINILKKYQDRGLNFKLSLMSQYFPAYKAVSYPIINRKPVYKEYSQVFELVEKYSMDGWVQEL